VVGSVIAYFLVEPLPVDTSLDDLSPADTGAHPALGIRNVKNKQKRVRELQRLLRGRRRLLLISLASGTAMLGGLTGVLNLPENSNRKLGAVMGFAFFLGMCYSPGVGAVPFLYSAEVWPNEARDVGVGNIHLDQVEEGLVLIMPFRSDVSRSVSKLLWYVFRVFGTL
jgi:hypothetical protein